MDIIVLKYHTVGIVLKYHTVGIVLKYHTVGIVLKSNRKIMTVDFHGLAETLQ